MLGQLVSAGRRVAGFGGQDAAAQTVQPQYVWCCSLQTADKTWCYLLRHSDVYELELWEVNKQGAPRRIDANVFSSIITPEGVQFGSSSCRFTAITACKGSQLSVQPFSPEGALLLLDQQDDGLRVWELPVPLSTGRPYWPHATNGGLFNEDVGAAQLRRHIRPDDSDLMLPAELLRPVGFVFLNSDAYVVLPRVVVKLPRVGPAFFGSADKLHLEGDWNRAGQLEGDRVLSVAVLALEAGDDVCLRTPGYNTSEGWNGTTAIGNPASWQAGDDQLTPKLRAAFSHFSKGQQGELERVMRLSLSDPDRRIERDLAILEVSRDDMLQVQSRAPGQC